MVEAWAWWLVQHVGVNIETAWQYVGVANSHHERCFGVPFAGGMSLDRVRGMLGGWQRLQRAPIVRRMRYGELVSGREPFFCFHRSRLPSRADVRFGFRDGVLVSCANWFVNSKARGSERFRKLHVVLPISGSLLSPGLALWYLCRVADPVSPADEASTPLFRDPATRRVLTVPLVRQRLRAIPCAVGRDSSLYGGLLPLCGGLVRDHLVVWCAISSWLRYRPAAGEISLRVNFIVAAAIPSFSAACGARISFHANLGVAYRQFYAFQRVIRLRDFA